MRGNIFCAPRYSQELTIYGKDFLKSAFIAIIGFNKTTVILIFGNRTQHYLVMILELLKKTIAISSSEGYNKSVQHEQSCIHLL